MIRCALVLGRSLVQLYELDVPEVSIGRDIGQHIRIDNDAVSRRHALLLHSAGTWTVQDLGTSNGTRLNGKPVDFAPLKPGDAIQVGKHTIVFSPTEQQIQRLEQARRTLGVSDRPAAGTLFMESGDIDSVMRGIEEQRSAHLRLVAAGSADKRYPLSRDPIILGRAIDADVVLRGFLVSRQHATITNDSQGYRLSALSGMRAVRVNGRRVWDHRLRNHDEIRIGPNRFRFFDEV